MTTIEPPKQYASESGRFYTRDGEPLNLVPNKSKPGEFRKATLADCRKISGLPSVTTILGVIAKPGLDTWKVDQYLEAAYDKPPGQGEECWEWMHYVKASALAKMDICRDLGTEVHGAINRHFKREDSEERFDPFIKAAVDALKEIGVWDKQNSQDLESEKTFASIDYGFGGCIDICLSSEPLVIDWKVLDRLDKSKEHLERASQLCAYSIGRYGKIGRCINIFISSSEPGKYEIKEWNVSEKDQAWKVFEAANLLWRAISNYHP